MPPCVKRGGFASGENDATKRWIDLMDGRPKLVHIDETNSRAAEKLLGSQEELVEDTYFLMQMPCVLPEMRNPEPRPKKVGSMYFSMLQSVFSFFFEEPEGSWSTFRKTKSSGSRRMPSQQVQVGCPDICSCCMHWSCCSFLRINHYQTPRWKTGQAADIQAALLKSMLALVQLKVG